MRPNLKHLMMQRRHEIVLRSQGTHSWFGFETLPQYQTLHFRSKRRIHTVSNVRPSTSQKLNYRMVIKETE